MSSSEGLDPSISTAPEDGTVTSQTATISSESTTFVTLETTTSSSSSFSSSPSTSTAPEDGESSSQPIVILSETTPFIASEITISSSISSSTLTSSSTSFSTLPLTSLSTSANAANPTPLPLSLPLEASVSSTSTVMVTTMVTILQSFTSTSANSPASTKTIYSPSPAHSPPQKSWPPQFHGPSGPGSPDAKTALLITAGIAGTCIIFLSISFLIFYCCWKRHRRRQKAKSAKDTKSVRKQSIFQPLTTHDVQRPRPSRPSRPPSSTFGSAKFADLAPPRQETQQTPPLDSSITPKPPSQRLPPFLVNYAQHKKQSPPPTSKVMPNVERYPVPVDYNTSSPRLKGHLAGLPINPRRPQNELQKSAMPLTINANLGRTKQPYRQPLMYDMEPWHETEDLPENNLPDRRQVPMNGESSQRSPASNFNRESPSSPNSSDQYYGRFPTPISSPTPWQPPQLRQQNLNDDHQQPPSGYTSDTKYPATTGSELWSWEAEDNLAPLPAFPKPPKPAIKSREPSAIGSDYYSGDFLTNYEDQHREGPFGPRSSIGYADSGVWTDVSVTSFQDPTEGSSKRREYTRASSQVLPF